MTTSSKALRVADFVLVAALVVSGQFSVWNADAGLLRGGRPLHAVLLALITVPLFVRRRWPLAVVAVVVLSAGLQYQLGGEVFEPWFAMLLALYSVAAHADRTAAVAGATIVTLVLLPVDVPKLLAGDPVDEVIPAWFVMGGVWAFGRWMRRRRRDTVALMQRAEAAERDRAERAAAAVAEERARIARELHDLVAHSMGVITIQSQAGQRALDTDPDAARGALAAIEATSRQGLGELRRLLGLLKSAHDGDVSPQPGLRDLDALVEQVESAGLRVELQRAGEGGPLPAGVDLAAYRIVQEALTNALKHAKATTARVVVRRDPTHVDVEITDDGVGTASANGRASDGGHGLVGMRERVSLYGGSLQAEGVPGGGFRVRARLELGTGS